ncbi:MAG: tRNA (N(6)-L-threonylcarbamoyladenosine(37)-C(2))-methylthiotransferase [Candidatus Thermoplasmatota archaeon]
MKIYLEVYGCAANKNDSYILRGILKENNFRIVKNIEDADFIIIFTCTVINTTEQRMLSRLREFKQTEKKVIVAGCMASVQQKNIKKILPEAITLPPQKIGKIKEILGKKLSKKKTLDKSYLPRYYDKITAPISISEGCPYSCSYCITRLARGKLKSFSEKKIISNIKNALQQGCREIQLTSQDTASYGLEKNTDLGILLKKTSSIKKDFRIRVGMMNPRSVQKNLKSIIEGFQHPNIYRFLHLPVQSGNDEILSKMNRGYTVDDFKEIVKKFRQSYPDMFLTTDFIVGFPT